jgi:phosphohistidine phosphatase
MTAQHKILILIRHAKAEERDISIQKQDADRDLTSDGKKDAIQMGKRLFSMKIKPDKMVSSPARRAFQTAQIIARELKMEFGKIKLENKIYEASVRDLLNVIRKSDDGISNLILVGHNPSFNELLNYLCKTNIGNIPKGGIVGISLASEKWKDTFSRSGTLLFFDSPKNR